MTEPKAWILGDRRISDWRPQHWYAPKLSPQQWDEVRERYEAGETPAELAAEFNVKASTIRQRLGRRSR